MKKRERSLLLSALCLSLTLVLLAGATLAWFTDSAVNAGNKVQAGSLDVKLLSDGEDITESADPVFDYTKWEPGYSTGATLQAVNNGTLALHYELQLQNVSVSGGLENVIEVYVGDTYKGLLKDFMNGEVLSEDALEAGTTGPEMAVKLVMQTTANNDYQNAAASFDILLTATQQPSEYDGFGSNEYDSGALTA